MTNTANFFKYKQLFIKIAIALCLCFIIYWAYLTLLAPTRIALINFPSYQVSNIILANDSRLIVADEVTPEEASSLSDYDAILLFGPGLRLSKAQIENINKAGEKGKAVYTFVFAPDIITNHNVDSLQASNLSNYYNNRCKENFRNMLCYIRQQFDKGKLLIQDAEKAVEVPSNIFYHLDDKKYFHTSDELTTHLKANNLFHEDAPRLALLSGMTSPLEGNKGYIDSLISEFTTLGYNVYPIYSSAKRLELLKTVDPNAVIYLPMGRLEGDRAVNWLAEKNIPLFCPYPIMQSHDEWINDPRGQIGGFLTARIVLPEIDGGICPLPLSTQNLHNGKYYVFDVEPDRVEHFVDNVNNYLQLKHKANKDKRLAICYFKGAGQSSLVATGLEVVPSLYTFLQKLQQEGYNIQNLPASLTQFTSLINKQGAILNPQAQGAATEFMQKGNPLWIKESDYQTWAQQTLDPIKYKEVLKEYGAFPGDFLGGEKDGETALAMACLQFGNIVVFPQPSAALTGDEFKMVHGANIAPPHSYIAPYLWAQKGFMADAFVHFGTHGSLEFTPGKQTALSNKDWADCLMGTMPHFYYYTISNVGEGIIAKRRLHASLVSYLTPPFMESNVRKQYDSLFADINTYHKASEKAKDQLSLRIKKEVVAMGIHKALQLDGDLSVPYSTKDIEYIENFAEEVSNEKMTGKLYTLGETYSKQDIISTTIAICADPLAYSLAKLDLLQDKITKKQYESNTYITKHYLNPQKEKIKKTLSKGTLGTNPISDFANINAAEIEKAHQINRALHGKQMSMESMMAMAAQMSEKENKGEELKRPANMPTTGEMPDFVKKMIAKKKENSQMMGGTTEVEKVNIKEEDRAFAEAVIEIENVANNVLRYKMLLEESPTLELQSLLNGLQGGYLAPSPGGDAVRNPNTLPTGRNLYSINAEATPSLHAWDNGKMLVNETLQHYKEKHNSYPRKVSYTLWAGEFIESEGATIAQILYMLGVEPVRDGMNRVTDLRLIPTLELGRPRIDVVVQTSGQLRDLAASRLLMITKAVKMAAEAEDGTSDNFVKTGTIESEKSLVEKGISPRDARDLSTMRIFGGLNGQYGTGIMELVEKGDAWEDDRTIADTYINNMGAIYGDDKNWGAFTKDLFEVALQNTDVVVQPRQNNTWGALSLDHMYEFMGGINLSVRHVTGKEPDTYLADYRNRNRIRMQELREAIEVESRTTILNPTYIKEKMKGSSSSANVFATTLRNTYAWNVMKPDVIDDEVWDEVYSIYVKDEQQLGIHHFFETESPASLQEITAVMLETARKGMWKASEEQLESIAQLHVDLVKAHGASGSDFTLDNVKLQKFIATKVQATDGAAYNKQITQVLQSATEFDHQVKDGMVLKRDQLGEVPQSKDGADNRIVVVGITLILFIVLLFILKRKRK